MVVIVFDQHKLVNTFDPPYCLIEVEHVLGLFLNRIDLFLR